MSTSLWILVAVAYVAWRALRARDLNPRAGKVSPLPKTRNDRSGDEGEARVQAELVEILTWLCGRNFYLHCGPLLLKHAPGTEFPTAEVDHLAITPFGIFVFETKNWTGLIKPRPSAEVLIRIGADGEPQARKSPLSQNARNLHSCAGCCRQCGPLKARAYSLATVVSYRRNCPSTSCAAPTCASG